MTRKQYTKKQHYIPRMILKNFTCSDISAKKFLVHQYDKDKNIERLVDIYDICRKNNLYEFKDKNGIIKEDLRNLIENFFSYFEPKWSKISKKISNYEILTEEDSTLLYLLFIFQFLRLPIVQNEGVKLYKDCFQNPDNHLTEIDIENWMKYISFPIGGDNTEHFLFDFIKEKLGEKELTICCTDDALAINGELPIMIYSNDLDCDFPITPNICLRLRQKHCNKDYVHLSKDEVREINNCTINKCKGRFIYSSIPYDDICK